jgi:hypothetical protein
MLTVSFARIRAGKEDRLRRWLTELASRQDEARQSLAQEGTRHEQLYVLPGSEGSVLVYVMEAEDVQRAYSAYGASRLPIDDEHRAVLAEVLEAPLDVAPLYECAVEGSISRTTIP